MKKLLTTLFCIIFVLLSCEKPSQGIVITPPNTHPTLNPGNQQGGGNQEGNQEGTQQGGQEGGGQQGGGQEGQEGGGQEGGGQGGQEGSGLEGTPITAPTGTIIVGYVTYWGSTLPDPTLLTHINYAFAHIKSDFESLEIKSESRLSKVAALKKTNPNLKIALSVGGWGAGNFSEMAADENHRKKFCQNCLTAVKKYNLDGIDLDWEYPTSSSAGISASPNDKDNFTLLVKDLRAALGSDRLVTMASSASAKYVNFRDFIDYMNFVNLMTYDMGDPPYHNAGLYKSSMTKRSCDESVTLHLNAGVPYEKIVLGVPFYGRDDNKAFSASDPDDNYVYYKDIVKGNYTDRWDDNAKVPYLTDASGTMVLSYDNETSIGLKADYVKQKGLKGAMYWEIGGDDSNLTLSKALASRLIGWVDPNPPQQAEAFLATNQYVEKFLEEVNYPCTNNPDTDIEYSYSSVIGYPGGGPSENKSVYFHCAAGCDRTAYSYKSIRKTIFSKTDSGTYQERIVKYLLQIGVPQKDIDDLREIMLK